MLPLQHIDTKGKKLFYQQCDASWHSSCSIAGMLSLGISHGDDTVPRSHDKILGVICIASLEETDSLS
jgi:hypothetical protein